MGRVTNWFSKLANVFKGKRETQAPMPRNTEIETPPEPKKPRVSRRYAGMKQKRCLHCHRVSPTHSGTKQTCTHCGSYRYMRVA